MTSRLCELAVAGVLAAFASGCALEAEPSQDVGTIASPIKDESKAASKADKEAAKADRKAARDAAKDARKADKARRKAERKARLREGFERYPVGTVPADFEWFAYGLSYVTVTDQQAARGYHSLQLVSEPNPAYRDISVGAKLCAKRGSESALTVDLRLRIGTPAAANSWAFLAVTNNPELAAYWWILPDGTVDTGFGPVGKIQLDTWTHVHIVVDLLDDLATLSMDGVSVETPISTTWGLIARPVECLRVASSAQNLFVDQVTVQPEILEL